MKLIRAEITGFGKYRQQVISFEAQNQLLFGPNEIGKSTLYQFIQCMLFGFPPRRTRQKDYTPKDGTAFGGKLWLAFPGVGEVYLERYKQVDRGRVKVRLGEQVGGEKLWKDLLQGLTPALFSEVFTFQQEQLSQLDHLQEEELQQVLLSLGITGSRQLMEQGQQYQKENQKNFRPKGQRLPLNEGLGQWQTLQYRIQEKEAAEARVQELLANRQTSREQLTTRRKEQRALKAALSQAKEQELHWQQYEEWQTLKTLKQSELALTPEQVQALEGVYQQYQGLTAQLKQIEEDYYQAKEAETVTPQYEFYLQHEGVIKSLLKQQVKGVRLTDEFHRSMARQDQLLGEINDLETQYGWQLPSVETVSLNELDDLSQKLGQIQERLQENQLQQKWLSTELTAGEAAQVSSAGASKGDEASDKTSFNRQKPSLTLISLALAAVFLLLGIFVLPQFKAILGIAAIACGIGGALWEYHQRQQTALKQGAMAKRGPVATPRNTQEQLARLQEQAEQLHVRQDQLAESLHQALGGRKIAAWADFPDYQSDYHRYYQSLLDLDQVTADLQTQDEAYGALLQEFDFLSNWLPLQELDLVGRFETLQQFDQKLTRQKQLQGQQKTTLLADQRKEMLTKINQLAENSQDLLQQTGVKSLAEVPERIQQAQGQAKQMQRLEELTKILTPLYPDPVAAGSLGVKIARLQGQLNELETTETTLLEQTQRQDLELEALAKDGTLDELRQEQADLEEVLGQQLIDWGARKIAGAALQDLATDLSEQQLPQLLQQAGHYLQILTNGKYHTLYFEEGQLVLQGTQEMGIQELSTGTKDQLIMALRFGYLHLQKKNLCPVIIDDGWLNYDSQRKRQLAQLLAEFGQKYQVICLSSDREMVSYYQDFKQPVQSLASIV